MIVIKVRHLKYAGVALVVASLLALVVVGVGLAAAEVTITTTPLKTDVEIFFDGASIGFFDVYDGLEPITFSWEAYDFPEGVNGSYYVTMVQNITPLGTPTWVVAKTGHHWADNPNGPVFVMGSFATNELCTTCPNKFIVQPETYEKVYDVNSNTYMYVYTPIEGTAMESEQFILEIPQVCDIFNPKGGYILVPDDQGDFDCICKDSVIKTPTDGPPGTWCLAASWPIEPWKTGCYCIYGVGIE